MSESLLQKLRILHGRLHDWRTIVLPYYKERIFNPKAVYLVLTPDHDNLGDAAIANAEKKILEELHIKYIEYTIPQIEELDRLGKLGIMDGRPIYITGGGNLGTLWFWHENFHRKIIQATPHSPVMVLPNSVFYEDSEKGRYEFEQSKRIYNSRESICVCLRERLSYEQLKDVYHHTLLCPDLVLSLKIGGGLTASQNRAGCLLCLRNDLEKTLSERETRLIKAEAEKLFGTQVAETSTCLGKHIRIEERNSEVEKKLKEFSSAELVITDRLHGMIFCAITSTPCIVLDSKSPKLRGCYEWIQHLDYIKFAENAGEIEEKYHTIPKNYPPYDSNEFQPLFQELKQKMLANIPWRISHGKNKRNCTGVSC